jgi:hypothetical protein
MTKEAGHLARGSAAEVCGRFALGEEARALLVGPLSPGQFLDLLRKRRLDQDATRMIANALPKREAVWWALSCAREAAGVNPSPASLAALESAQAWVREPSEENRRATLAAAEAAGLGTSSGCAALAAFWSGGSLGPPGTPVVPPAEHLTAHAAAGAVMLAVVESEPEKAAEKYRAFLSRGVAVADGTDTWESAPKVEPPRPALGTPSARRPDRLRWE